MLLPRKIIVAATIIAVAEICFYLFAWTPFRIYLSIASMAKRHETASDDSSRDISFSLSLTGYPKIVLLSIGRQAIPHLIRELDHPNNKMVTDCQDIIEMLTLHDIGVSTRTTDPSLLKHNWELWWRQNKCKPDVDWVRCALTQEGTFDGRAKAIDILRYVSGQHFGGYDPDNSHDGQEAFLKTCLAWLDTHESEYAGRELIAEYYGSMFGVYSNSVMVLSILTLTLIYSLYALIVKRKYFVVCLLCGFFAGVHMGGIFELSLFLGQSEYLTGFIVVLGYVTAWMVGLTIVLWLTGMLFAMPDYRTSTLLGQGVIGGFRISSGLVIGYAVLSCLPFTAPSSFSVTAGIPLERIIVVALSFTIPTVIVLLLFNRFSQIVMVQPVRNSDNSGDTFNSGDTLLIDLCISKAIVIAKK